MSGEKFTEGPWHVDGEGLTYDILNRDGVQVAGEIDFIHDAHLIAAATDLYHALVSMTMMFDIRIISPILANEVDAALKKARGETP